ncbi:phage distal tail protein [Streptomyces corynorhini]|uniref:Phage tail protein n=1 Tax=Streptomyces corynorhini TaxID=2282652 RepID=A0A370B9J9_9ACTN|nr:phage tail protein [Streptomyces corynorhini]RDG38477.1 phage tail protein [Streptomyces corynorhini]
MAETTNAHIDDPSPGSLITRDGQIQWARLLMGPGTPYPVDRAGITGWDDLPGIDTGDVPRPDQHGSWPGSRWAQPRLIDATVWLLPESAEEARATTGHFRAATGLDGGERWLAVRLHGETLAVRARVSRRVVPQDRTYVLHGAARTSLQWTSTDPRRFGTDEQSARTGLPASEPGLAWPDEGLGWPLDWGAAGATGALTAVNSGDTAAHPLIEFRGPAKRPSLIRLSDGKRLQYDITLAADDVLTVDTLTGTVVLNATASRLYTATAASAPEQLFLLEPGTTSLAFRSEDIAPDPAALATVRWRHSHW